MSHPVRTPDAAAVRVVARLRAALAIGVAGTGSFVHTSGRVSWLFVFLGLAWVPWTCAVLFAADRAGDRFAQLGGPIGDLVALFAVQAFLPGSDVAALLGYLLVVGFAVYTLGRPAAALLGAGALSLTFIAQAAVHAPDRLTSSALVPFSAALVALVFLFERTVTLQHRAAARSERLQGQSDAILAHVADGVVVTDGAGRVTLWNPAAQRIAGCHAEDAFGRNCGEVLDLHIGERPLDCSRGCALLDPKQNPDGDLGCEVWRLDETGRRQPLLANAAGVTDGAGELLEVVHSLRDVTRLKQAEEAKTLFLATASHELKTPLTVINGFAQTLLAFPQTDETMKQDALQAIVRRAQELSRIVDRLLLSSRIEAGRIHVELKLVELVPILRERTTALTSATTRHVDCAIDGDLPPVFGDEAALVTVFDHLLDNALKYSPDGGSVTLTAAVDGDDVRVDVSDEGIGMSPEDMRSCFDKFWQAESTDVRRFGGTGIGLYIVRSLVDASGGRIGVRSEPGAGSTFSVWLRTVEERPVQPPPPPGVGEASSIREFMRQIGVPGRSQ